MYTTELHNERIAQMTFVSVYLLYLAKIMRKGRTELELLLIIEWLTGYNASEIKWLIAEKVNFQEFFEKAHLHPNAHKITGMICGYRIEELENAITRQVRYLDKLIDELAKGKTLEKVMR
jgi:hypothetical protein